jgi:hypothetical protein
VEPRWFKILSTSQAHAAWVNLGRLALPLREAGGVAARYATRRGFFRALFAPRA